MFVYLNKKFSEYSIDWNYLFILVVLLYISLFEISKLILEEIHPYKHDKTVKSMWMPKDV